MTKNPTLSHAYAVAIVQEWCAKMGAGANDVQKGGEGDRNHTPIKYPSSTAAAR
ncbi:hypothetical protein MTBLM5_140024 [Magnetospirillum sp. LM-5]|nr:hypothetical protein MTBLM5_140024 [Magnetospirillum sp. LM-5]